MYDPAGGDAVYKNVLNSVRSASMNCYLFEVRRLAHPRAESCRVASNMDICISG